MLQYERRSGEPNTRQGFRIEGIFGPAVQPSEKESEDTSSYRALEVAAF